MTSTRARALHKVHRKHHGIQPSRDHARQIALRTIKGVVMPRAKIPTRARQTGGRGVEVRIDREKALVQRRRLGIDFNLHTGQQEARAVRAQADALIHSRLTRALRGHKRVLRYLVRKKDLTRSPI